MEKNDFLKKKIFFFRKEETGKMKTKDQGCGKKTKIPLDPVHCY